MFVQVKDLSVTSITYFPLIQIKEQMHAMHFHMSREMATVINVKRELI